MQELKKKVLEANLELVRQGLVIYTWGNASGIDRDRGLVVIMDNRINTKRYGQDFINSIPRCTRITGSVRDLPKLALDWLNKK